MLYTDICIIGAGPAGLAAAIEAAKSGAKVTIVDENHLAGGQLFKQIHKFFGSSAHHAGIRGITIGEKMMEEALELGVEMRLRTVAYGIFENGIIGINDLDLGEIGQINAKKIIIATGALENALPFKGWTLPGVMGAGAAQTLMNIHRLKPGNNALMVGTGNVGLIVSYQMLQAGVNVKAIIEAAPIITGYHVHARKVMRAGVPIYTYTTIQEAKGVNCVETATIKSLKGDNQKQELDVDLICLAVGLNPLTELLRLAGCEFIYNKCLGGYVPAHDLDMRTSNSNVYVAGDSSGVEEASSAMEEGRIAGIAAAESLGYIDKNIARTMKDEYGSRLDQLREGPFGERRRAAKSEILRGERYV